MQSKPTDPRKRMGIYKTLDEVPDRYRLYHHADAYAGRNVWAEFCDEYLFDHLNSKRSREDTCTFEQRWKDHMDEQGRHHALATPADIEAWCTTLLDNYSERWAYQHFIRIEGFYEWLQFHTEHPHRYHPVLMAAAEYEDGAAGVLWEYKIAASMGVTNNE